MENRQRWLPLSRPILGEVAVPCVADVPPHRFTSQSSTIRHPFTFPQIFEERRSSGALVSNSASPAVHAKRRHRRRIVEFRQRLPTCRSPLRAASRGSLPLAARRSLFRPAPPSSPSSRRAAPACRGVARVASRGRVADRWGKASPFVLRQAWNPNLASPPPSAVASDAAGRSSLAAPALASSPVRLPV